MMPSLRCRVSKVQVVRTLSICFCFTFAEVGASPLAINLVPVSGTWGMPIGPTHEDYVLLDGQAAKVKTNSIRKLSALPLRICNDSLDSWMVTSDSCSDFDSCAVNSSKQFIYPPYHPVKFTADRGWGRPDDVAFYRNGGEMPWLVVGEGLRKSIPHLPEVAFCRDSAARPEIHFPRPGIIRAPFLTLFPEAYQTGQADSVPFEYAQVPGGAENQIGPCSFDGGFHQQTSNILPHSFKIENRNWMMIWDISPGKRSVIVPGNTAGDGRSNWILSFPGYPKKAVVFYDLTRNEPSRVESMFAPKTKKPFWVLELHEGQRLHLRVIGQDTVFTTVIADLGGEDGVIPTWSINQKAGTVSVKPPKGRAQVVFRAR